eukprot:2970-Eustigmatos_ZCMA.PRE.1
MPARQRTDALHRACCNVRVLDFQPISVTEGLQTYTHATLDYTPPNPTCSSQLSTQQRNTQDPLNVAH